MNGQKIFQHILQYLVATSIYAASSNFILISTTVESPEDQIMESKNFNTKAGPQRSPASLSSATHGSVLSEFTSIENPSNGRKEKITSIPLKKTESKMPQASFQVSYSGPVSLAKRATQISKESKNIPLTAAKGGSATFNILPTPLKKDLTKTLKDPVETALLAITNLSPTDLLYSAIPIAI